MIYLKSNPYTKLYISGAIFVLILLVILDIIFLENWKDIIVEVHGLLFDIFFFGLIFTLYASYTERKMKIESFKDEIDDYRF